MPTLRRETDYALHFLRALSKKRGDFVSLKTISIETGVSYLFLQKIARKLRQADIIESGAGVSGGYKLKVDPKKISLHKIISVIEGPCALWRCCGKKGCVGSGTCPQTKKVQRINKKVEKVLEGVMLTDL